MVDPDIPQAEQENLHYLPSTFTSQVMNVALTKPVAMVAASSLQSTGSMQLVAF